MFKIMTKKNIKLLLNLLNKSFKDYGDQISYSSYFVEPEKVNLDEFMEVLEEELKKIK